MSHARRVCRFAGAIERAPGLRFDSFEPDVPEFCISSSLSTALLIGFPAVVAQWAIRVLLYGLSARTKMFGGGSVVAVGFFEAPKEEHFMKLFEQGMRSYVCLPNRVGGSFYCCSSLGWEFGRGLRASSCFFLFGECVYEIFK